MVVREIEQQEALLRKKNEKLKIEPDLHGINDSLGSVSEALCRLIKNSILRGRRRGEAKLKSGKGYGSSWKGEEFPRTNFDIECFMTRTYVVSAPSFPIGCTIPCYRQRKRKIAVPPPTVQYIEAFISHFVKGARLEPECMISALIYIDRISRGRRGVCLTPRNWLSITMVALLTASKVWEDNPAWNGHFARLFPSIPIRGLNRLEFAFIAQLQFNLHISQKVYSDYFFALRALKEKQAVRERSSKDVASMRDTSPTRRKYYEALSRSSSSRGIATSASFARLSRLQSQEDLKAYASGATRGLVAHPEELEEEEEEEIKHVEVLEKLQKCHLGDSKSEAQNISRQRIEAQKTGGVTKVGEHKTENKKVGGSKIEGNKIEGSKIERSKIEGNKVQELLNTFAKEERNMKEKMGKLVSRTPEEDDKRRRKEAKEKIHEDLFEC